MINKSESVIHNSKKAHNDVLSGSSINPLKRSSDRGEAIIHHLDLKTKPPFDELRWQQES